jgi:hypothetical protein
VLASSRTAGWGITGTVSWPIGPERGEGDAERAAAHARLNGLVDLVEDIAGVRLERRYDLSAPKGVNGRNSDNTRIKAVLGWEPSCATGWRSPTAGIYDQVQARRRAAS